MKRVYVQLDGNGILVTAEHRVGEEPVELVIVNWLDKNHDYRPEDSPTLFRDESGDDYLLEVFPTVVHEVAFPPEENITKTRARFETLGLRTFGRQKEEAK